MPDKVTLTINGKTVVVDDGATVLAAIYESGQTEFRRSVSGEPRAPLCGMGVCFECCVTINGLPHQRSCQTRCRPGMRVKTDE